MEKLRTIPKPGKDEYPPYSEIYMELAADDGMVLQQLRDNLAAIKTLIYGLPEEKLLYRYAEGKWSIKEVLVHLIDDERIFAYRALRFARNDQTEVPGFEQDDGLSYCRSRVAACQHNQRAIFRSGLNKPGSMRSMKTGGAAIFAGLLLPGKNIFCIFADRGCLVLTA